MIHRCQFPLPDPHPLKNLFVCRYCRAVYTVRIGPRHGFLWLKRTLSWERRWNW